MNPEKELENLEGLLRDFMEAVNIVLQSGEELSDEFQGEIAKTLGLLVERIDQIQLQMQEQSPVDNLSQQVEESPHASSNINAFRYDPKSQRLVVKFQDKYPAQNGPVYSYEGVPPFIYDVFQRGAVAPKTSGKNAWHTWKKGVTPSHGASMYALIKGGGYNYKKLS